MLASQLTTSNVRLYSWCDQEYQFQRRRGPGFCSVRCRVAAHRSAKRSAEELQVLADTGDRIWVEVRDGDSRGAALYDAHYSHRLFGRQRKPDRRFVGPGGRIVLLTPDAGALFVWRRFIEPGQTSPRGIYCSVFRRE